MNQSNVKLECKGLLLKVLVWGLPPFCFVLIQLEINWIIEVVVECVWDVNPSMRGRGTDDNALFAVNGICNWKLIDKKGREEKSGTYTALRLQLWIMTRYHSGRLRCSGPSQSWSELQPAIQSPNHSCFAILCLSSKKVMTHFRPFVFFPLFLSCVLCAIWRLENKPSTLKIPSSFDVSTVLPAKSSASTSPSGPCNAHSFSCLSVRMYVCLNAYSLWTVLVPDFHNGVGQSVRIRVTLELPNGPHTFCVGRGWRNNNDKDKEEDEADEQIRTGLHGWMSVCQTMYDKQLFALVFQWIISDGKKTFVADDRGKNTCRMWKKGRGT